MTLSIDFNVDGVDKHAVGVDFITHSVTLPLNLFWW